MTKHSSQYKFKSPNPSAPTKPLGRKLANTPSTALSQSLKGEQKFVLKPKLLASLKLLSLPRSDLKKHIEGEINNNPFLEVDRQVENPSQEETPSQEDALSAVGAPISIETSREQNFITETDAYLEIYTEASTPRTPLEKTSLPKDSPLKTTHKNLATIIEETTPKAVSLAEELLLQLSLAYPPGTPRYLLGEILISMIDSDGFLAKTDIKTIKKDLARGHYKELLNVDPKWLDEVLITLQNFTPGGIAAATIQEALLIQLKRLAHSHSTTITADKKVIALATTLVKDHFTQLTQSQLTALAKKLNVTPDLIQKALHQISLLEPKPARNYRPLNNLYVEADATIEIKNNTPTLILHNDYLKNLRLSPTYINHWKKLRHHKSLEPIDPTFKAYLDKQKQNAQDLIENLTFRKSHLEKILLHLIEKQADFFLKGFAYLKPYSLLELAKDLNIDKGTISRLVNQKYIATSWGLIPLRKLFSATKIQVISSQKTSPTVASVKKIEALIKNIIDTYPEKRISDQKIADMLHLRGYQVARRTITKYRQRMNILSSFDRQS